MGIYIPGMEIPNEGYLIVRIYANREVYEPTNCAYILNKVATAIPIPPHGDLIEKHNIFKLIWDFPEIDKLLTVEFMKALYNLPTIIPAEEDE